MAMHILLRVGSVSSLLTALVSEPDQLGEEAFEDLIFDFNQGRRIFDAFWAALE